MKDILENQIIVDLDANPRRPDHLREVADHKKGGQFEWNPEKVKLFLNDEQKDGKKIEGYELQKKLEEMPVFNANLLDYLKRHKHLIPDEWKVDENGNIRYIYFWGTTYCDALTQKLYVRYMFFCEGQWQEDIRWIGYDWDSNSPAVVLVD